MLAGGLNVLSCDGLIPAKGNYPIDIEKLLNIDPDVIVTRFAGTAKAIRSDPRWARLKAVKAGRVSSVPAYPFNWFDRPPSFMRIMGARWLAAKLHPRPNACDQRARASAFYALFFGVTPGDADLDLLSRDERAVIDGLCGSAAAPERATVLARCLPTGAAMTHCATVAGGQRYGGAWRRQIRHGSGEILFCAMAGACATGRRTHGGARQRRRRYPPAAHRRRHPGRARRWRARARRSRPCSAIRWCRRACSACWRGPSFGAALGIVLGASWTGVQTLAFVMGLAAVAFGARHRRAVRRRAGGHAGARRHDQRRAVRLASVHRQISSPIPYNQLAEHRLLADGQSRRSPICAGEGHGAADVRGRRGAAARWAAALDAFWPWATTRRAASACRCTRLRYGAIALATLVSALTVSLAGMIGWVGLIVPHVARLALGAGERPTDAGERHARRDLSPRAPIALARTLAEPKSPSASSPNLLGIPVFMAVLGRVRRGWNE